MAYIMDETTASQPHTIFHLKFHPFTYSALCFGGGFVNNLDLFLDPYNYVIIWYPFKKLLACCTA